MCIIRYLGLFANNWNGRKMLFWLNFWYVWINSLFAGLSHISTLFAAVGDSFGFIIKEKRVMSIKTDVSSDPTDAFRNFAFSL